MSVQYAFRSRHTTQKKSQTPTSRAQGQSQSNRARVLATLFHLLLFTIVCRLFYWQVIQRAVLQAEAQGQYTRVVPITGSRGKIYSSDNYLLVGNETVYRVYAQPYVMKTPAKTVAALLAPLLLDPVQPVIETATPSSAPKPQTLEELQATLLTKLSDSDSHWAVLKSRVSQEVKDKIAALDIEGVGFESYQVRSYPEASMAAQVLGFVGKDKSGNDQGYFGIEGSLDREIRGKELKKTFLKDALGLSLLFGNKAENTQFDGRDVYLTLRRDIQRSVEELLKEGMEKYQAAAGEVIVMDPETGKILAMADFPSYDPARFFEYSPQYYKNASLINTFEPGSIFKVLTVAAGIDSGAITEETQCPDCATAKTIGKYTIKTWNEKYTPNITMTDALVKSDNVAMVYVAEQLGQQKFLDYIKKFGIGSSTNVELQEDTSTPLRKDWKVIDLATSSFGQGIVTTGMQMVKAIGAVANHGQMMKPQIIDKVIDQQSGSELPVLPQTEGQVISASSAAAVTRMMVAAANLGESKWTTSKTHNSAAKTGTAQIPIDGHYDDTQTLASYIGFAPPDHPKFVMLVKLTAPQSSPWAAETAAPLWYKIADKLFLLLNLPPDK